VGSSCVGGSLLFLLFRSFFVPAAAAEGPLGVAAFVAMGGVVCSLEAFADMRVEVGGG
jgi:hypothetical protein